MKFTYFHILPLSHHTSPARVIKEVNHQDIPHSNISNLVYLSISYIALGPLGWTPSLLSLLGWRPLLLVIRFPKTFATAGLAAMARRADLRQQLRSRVPDVRLDGLGEVAPAWPARGLGRCAESRPFELW